MQPIVQIKIFIFHRLQYRRHHTRDRDWPLWMRCIFDVDDLFPFPLTGIRLPEMDLICAQRRTAKAVGAVRVVVEFHFKRDQQISELLAQGLRVARKGFESGDQSLLPILIQSHAYIAANHQLNQRPKEAMEYFLLQAELCAQHGYRLQAMPAFHQALNIAQRKAKRREEEIILRAQTVGKELSDEELQFSDYQYIAMEFLRISRNRPDLQEESADDQFVRR